MAQRYSARCILFYITKEQSPISASIGKYGRRDMEIAIHPVALILGFVAQKKLSFEKESNNLYLYRKCCFKTSTFNQLTNNRIDDEERYCIYSNCWNYYNYE